MTVPVRRLRRLLVLLPSAAVGGAERHTATLAHALAEAGVDVTVAAEPALLPGLAPLFRPLALVAAPIGWREEKAMEANAARQSGAAMALIARHAPEAALLPLPWPSHGLGLAPVAGRVEGLFRLALCEVAVVPNGVTVDVLVQPFTEHDQL